MSPTSYQLLHPAIFGAEDRNRTGTVFNHRRILSPVRLPVPPLQHICYYVPINSLISIQSITSQQHFLLYMMNKLLSIIIYFFKIGTKFIVPKILFITYFINNLKSFYYNLCPYPLDVF